MTEEARKLVFRMVLATMSGEREITKELYEKYLRETRLYVTIKELLKAKKQAI